MDNGRKSVRGTIFDIKKYALHDGPGIRTTVFFKGCPLNCLWCHNPESRHPGVEKLCVKMRRPHQREGAEDEQQTVGRIVSTEDVVQEVLTDELFYDQSGGGVTISGGEPMIQPDFLLDLLSRCREHGIHTAVDTCGYAPWEDFEKIYSVVDLFLFDLKTADPVIHREYTGVGNELILDNLKRLASRGRKVQIRIPVIPGFTDADENLEAIAEHIGGLTNISTVSLLPYNRMRDDKCDRFYIKTRVGQLDTQTTRQMRAKGRRFIERGYEVRIGG